MRTGKDHNGMMISQRETTYRERWNDLTLICGIHRFFIRHGNLYMATENKMQSMVMYRGV